LIRHRTCDDDPFDDGQLVGQALQRSSIRRGTLIAMPPALLRPPAGLCLAALTLVHKVSQCVGEPGRVVFASGENRRWE
jgi:hypothetical protein